MLFGPFRRSLLSLGGRYGGVTHGTPLKGTGNRRRLAYLFCSMPTAIPVTQRPAGTFLVAHMRPRSAGVACNALPERDFYASRLHIVRAAHALYAVALPALELPIYDVLLYLPTSFCRGP